MLISSLLKIYLLSICIYLSISNQDHEHNYFNQTVYNHRRNLRSKKLLTAGLKLKPPDMPKAGKGWNLCDYKTLQPQANPEKNFVWPMETVERIFFYIHGLRMLLGSTEGRFKITEPLIYDNKLAVEGVPITKFMTFTGYPNTMVPFDDWRKLSAQNRENDNNVFHLDLYEIKEEETPPCPLEKKSQFCYMLKTSETPHRFALAYQKGANIGPDGWNSIFTLIRQNDNRINDDTVVTVGLYFLWYHPLFNSKIMDTSQREFKPIQVAEYMNNAAKYFMSKIKGSLDVAIAWRIQRQFSTSIRNTVKSDLDANPDKGGFVVGCQLGHIIKTIRRRENDANPALLIFDIFANEGGGADRKVGPTRVVRRQIVRAFKAYFKNIVVVEAAIKKMTNDEITSNMDPMKIYQNDKETFIVWLEVALGANVKQLVNAGGHFAEAIATFRDAKGVLEVLHPEFCNPVEINWETGQTIENDDLANALFGPQNA